MKTEDIQEKVYQWALSHNFTAPYGILTSTGISRKGKKFSAVTFGYAGTLDATVEIYNSRFMRLITSRNHHAPEVFKSFDELMNTLKNL